MTSVPSDICRVVPLTWRPLSRSMLMIAGFLVQAMAIAPATCRLLEAVGSYAPNETVEVEDTRQVAATLALTVRLPIAVAASAADGKKSVPTTAAIAPARAKK